jgi:hypothetical protein
MNISRLSVRTAMLIGLTALCGSATWAQSPAATTSAGPGRIICGSATSCDLGVGTPPSIRYKIDPSSLPDADKTRLKQCTAKAAPCVATATGSETKTGIKAASIKFYN